MSQLIENRIIAAAGHSSATEQEMGDATERGLTHIIHIWSGQSSVEMIADGKHLPPTLIKIAHKCVGSARLCIVSDSSAGTGLPEGSKFRDDEQEHEVVDGVGMTLDRTSFAGSTTPLSAMVRFVVTSVGLPLHEAIRMASLSPATVVGADVHKGSISEGKDADLLFLKKDLSVAGSMLAGRWARTPSEVTLSSSGPYIGLRKGEI